MAVASANGGPTWKWVAGVLLAGILGLVGYMVPNMFFSRAEGKGLEERQAAHETDSTYRWREQSRVNASVNQSVSEIRTEQRRISDNIIRIGEKLRVRDLDTGDEQ